MLQQQPCIPIEFTIMFEQYLSPDASLHLDMDSAVSIKLQAECSFDSAEYSRECAGHFKGVVDAEAVWLPWAPIDPDC